MQTDSHESFASVSFRTLFSKEAKKFLTHPLLKPCVFVLIAMLVMVSIALSVGLWWDSLWTAG